jgi:hypothetical protein
MGTFQERHKLLKLSERCGPSEKRPIINEETEVVIQKLSHKEKP